jgi:Ca2+-binding RTX toxin-like protein
MKQIKWSGAVILSLASLLAACGQTPAVDDTATPASGKLEAKAKGAGGGGGVQDRNVYGTIGNDILQARAKYAAFGFAGNDTITGTAGAESIFGGDGNDTIQALGDNDYVDGGLGNDFMDGGTGIDTLGYFNDLAATAGASATAGVTVNLNLTTAQITGGAGTDTIIGFENIHGSQFNDVLTGLATQSSTIFAKEGNDRITGGAAHDILWGEAGDDTIDGGAGIDFIFGNAGNDTLRGGAGDDYIYGDYSGDTAVGNDVIDGGLGNDHLSYEYALAGVKVDLNVLTAQNTGGAGIDTVSNIEWINGSKFADVLTGNALANRLNGIGGADILNGMGGDDLVDGTGTGDTANGGDGNDRVAWATFCNGGNGNDLLISGNAQQTMTGGAGADTFLFDAINFQGTSQAGAVDIITDYSRVQGDKIDLHNMVLGTNFIGYAEYSTFVGLTQIKTKSHVGFQTIEADLNGDRISDFVLQINGNTPLVVTDFVL